MRGLQIDPRKATSFRDLNISLNTLSKLPSTFREPWGIQRKILSVASSNLSCVAQSVPSLGKSTAAIISMVERARMTPDKITNLVVVPGQDLAYQYVQTINKLMPGSVETLYRTGSVKDDQVQHSNLQKNPSPHILVATPSRLLDYLCHTDLGVRLSNLSQVVVDELDVYPTRKGKAPVEILLEYILGGQSRPSLIFLASPGRPLSFEYLPDLLEGWGNVYDIRQQPPASEDFNIEVWTRAGRRTENVNISSRYEKEPDPVKALKQCWKGPGVVVLPHSASIPQFQAATGGELAVFKPDDLAGLNVPHFSRLYILGIEESMNLVRLKWLLRGPPKELIIHLVDSNPLLASEKLSSIVK